MKIKMKVIVYNRNLRNPDSITVECGKEKKTFPVGEYTNRMTVLAKVEQWILELWKKEREKSFGFVPLPKARVYFNIDWDSDHVLFCDYVAE